jgi:hypothetical protein
MRGQEKSYKSIILSGNIYLLHHDDDAIETPTLGDIYLYLNDEKILCPIILSDYKIKGYKGYFKAKIYDGRQWCLLNALDFFEDRLNQFGKNEICLYTFELCKERLAEAANTIVYRTYREHYSTYLHVTQEYKGKKSTRKINN